MTNSKVERIAWDSSVVLELLNRTNESHYSVLDELIRSAQTKEIEIVLSTMAITETIYLCGVEREEEERLINQFFLHDFIRLTTVDIRVARQARRLRIDILKLSPTDSVMLATAQVQNCSTFLTLDGDRATKKNEQGLLLPLDNTLSLPGTPGALKLRIQTPAKFWAGKPSSEALFPKDPDSIEPQESA